MQNRMLFKSGRAVVFMVILSLAPLLSAAQAVDWRNRIDMLVQEADSLSFQRQYTFYLHKFDRKNRAFREIWHYTVAGKNVLIFEVHHFRDSLEFLETYYLDGSKLICMEQYEILYPDSEEDEHYSGAVYFFKDEILRQQVSMGSTKESKYMGDGAELVKNFRNRYKELLQNRSLIEPKHTNPLF